MTFIDRLKSKIKGLLENMNPIPQMNKNPINLVKNNMKNIDAGAKASVRYTGKKGVTVPQPGDKLLLDKTEKGEVHGRPVIVRR